MNGEAVEKINLRSQINLNVPESLSMLKVFGDESLNIDSLFPTLEQLKSFQKD